MERVEDAGGDDRFGIKGEAGCESESECFPLESGLEFDSGSCCALVGNFFEERERELESESEFEFEFDFEAEACLGLDCGDDDNFGERWRLPSLWKSSWNGV